MIRLAAIGMLAALAGAEALAQSQSPPLTFMPRMPAIPGVHLPSACVEDRRRFCKGVMPGHGQLIDCYVAHRSQLSGKCVAQIRIVLDLREMQKKREAWLAAQKPHPAPPAQSPVPK